MTGTCVRCVTQRNAACVGRKVADGRNIRRIQLPGVSYVRPLAAVDGTLLGLWGGRDFWGQ